MYLSNIISRVSRPMLITPEGLMAIQSVIRNHLMNKTAEVADLFADEDQPEPYDLMPGVRVVPVHGYIGYRVGALEKSCGVCDIGEVAQWVETAGADPTIETILMDVSSGGGEVTYVQEAAERIMAVGKTKNIVSYTDTMACSAAQWLAASANEMYATPSADLGSIGCVISLLDMSEMYKNEGVERKVYTSGKLKAIGVEGAKITELQDQYLKDQVNMIGEQFKSFMKSRMPNLKDEDMEGQPLSGQYLYDNGNLTGLVLSAREIFE